MADTKTQQYFDAHPDTQDVRRSLGITIRGHEYTVVVSNSVFSTHRLDLGTKVLLDRVPSPSSLTSHILGHSVHMLDMGCGWGPLSLGLAREAPSEATIWALDVNERAVELTTLNSAAAGFKNVRAGTAESFTSTYGREWADTQFDLIWSNPPIRVGKDALHTLLMTYLPRLAVNGVAYMVVQKHLGADSLMTWLDKHLNDDSHSSRFSVSKFASAKGYRIIEVTRTR
ncbi:class I SAM-dependent methyltransferase [Alloscardovia venturai]|uniref:Class I SAM-dependent methyltransferase n=1 Tax=Alloscardovia venturai TaxID=1769421 RepID=A0ABW2Y610_9BIFI